MIKTFAFIIYIEHSRLSWVIQQRTETKILSSRIIHLWKKKKKSASKVESLLEVINAMERNKKMGMQGGKVGGYCFGVFLNKIFICIYFLFLLIYFWLHWVFIVVQRAFSCCNDQGLLSSAGRAFLLWSTGSRA